MAMIVFVSITVCYVEEVEERWNHENQEDAEWVMLPNSWLVARSRTIVGENKEKHTHWLSSITSIVRLQESVVHLQIGCTRDAEKERERERERETVSAAVYPLDSIQMSKLNFLC